MSVIKKVKIMQPTGEFSDAVDIGAKASNIDIEGGTSLQDIFTQEDNTIKIKSELIPNGNINLSNYYTKEEIDSLIKSIKDSGLTEKDVNNIIDNREDIPKWEDQPLGCFVAGTKVLTNNGLVNIEDLKDNDIVVSKNLDTSEIELKEIYDYVSHGIYELFELNIDNEIIITTGNHPFYIKDGWINARDLEVGMEIETLNNEYKAIKEITIKKLKDEIQVYNFHVKDNANYYVGENRFLVHNAIVTGSY